MCFPASERYIRKRMRDPRIVKRGPASGMAAESGRLSRMDERKQVQLPSGDGYRVKPPILRRGLPVGRKIRGSSVVLSEPLQWLISKGEQNFRTRSHKLALNIRATIRICQFTGQCRPIIGWKPERFTHGVILALQCQRLLRVHTTVRDKIAKPSIIAREP
jgi:hypothetical protein